LLRIYNGTRSGIVFVTCKKTRHAGAEMVKGCCAAGRTYVTEMTRHGLPIYINV